MEEQQSIEAVEASMIDPEIVVVIRELKARGWGDRSVARELGLDKKTVKRWLEGPAERKQVRLRARKLNAADEELARALFVGLAEGNAVVVKDELQRRGLKVSERTVQRVVAGVREAQVAAEVATLRFETEPGEQMQVDFGQKRVNVGGIDVVVHLMAAVLGYSRRIFAKAFLVERADDWRDGIASAFRHFGGSTRTLLVDNSRCLVLRHDVANQSVVFNRALVEMSKDFGCVLRACRPYRARTKGKIESGVKFIKRNALAGRSFASFAALESHLSAWMLVVDERIHGTTHTRPSARFEQERRALLPLPSSTLRIRGERRLKRRVSNDAFVDLDTVRYSVPLAVVRRNVDVVVVDDRIRVFADGKLVADHAKCSEPHHIIEDVSHRDGLYRSAPTSTASSSNEFARPLADYVSLLEGPPLPRPSGLPTPDSPPIPKRIDDEVRGQGSAA